MMRKSLIVMTAALLLIVITSCHGSRKGRYEVCPAFGKANTGKYLVKHAGA